MSLIARYVLSGYLRAFAMAMVSIVLLYLVIDVFERLPDLVEYNAEPADMLGYFAYKVPSILSEIYPAAVLLAVLIGIGMLQRHCEILALRACGISTWRLALPLVALAAIMTVGAVAWNESVVPPTAARSRYLYDVVIKKKIRRGAFNAASLWFQDERGFVNIDYYDADNERIYGLRLYDAQGDHRLARVLEIPLLSWDGERWNYEEGHVKRIDSDGLPYSSPIDDDDFSTAETPASLADRERRPEEFSFAQLREQVRILRAKGLNADSSLVDLHRKTGLAVCRSDDGAGGISAIGTRRTASGPGLQPVDGTDTGAWLLGSDRPGRIGWP